MSSHLCFSLLASNTALEILDLSWNHLRRKGTVALGTGLRVGTPLFCDTLHSDYYQKLFETLGTHIPEV